ncbi:nickel pincer cofactor biosynthesis protein LarC [Methanobrevibacter sp.]|uniref:nickel pincer cofactor biosynthesis protein LarC n=1 Tax=Methanobrevibacter sp. TaxID=66852 RepID=UPI0038907F94
MVYIIDSQTAGISGNMIIGALVDLGADGEKVKNLMEDVAFDFGEVEVSLSKVNKAGIGATFCNVKTINEEHENNNHIHYSDFMEKIDLLKFADIENLTDDMVEKAKKVFKRIAISESRVHGKTLEDVHFHEVGAADAVADVLGSICAYYDLGMDKDKVVGLPIAVGGGVIESAHGRIPVPAPASIDILKGLDDDEFKDFSKGEAKCVGGPVNSELATPTGCALYMEFCDEFLEFAPMMSPEVVAYGCGSKDFDFPNILRVIKSKETNEKHRISVIETNIDHMSGEELGFLFDLLLIEGASDVSMVPITMKKNRPGHMIKIISKPSLVDHLVNILFKETGTLGIRISENTHRGVAERQFVPLDINVGNHVYTINFKIGLIGDEIISHRPEYEDLRRISVEQDIPLVEIRDVANTMIRDFLENNRE